LYIGRYKARPRKGMEDLCVPQHQGCRVFLQFFNLVTICGSVGVFFGVVMMAINPLAIRIVECTITLRTSWTSGSFLK